MLPDCNLLYCVGLQVTQEALGEVAMITCQKVWERNVDELFPTLMGWHQLRQQMHTSS